MLVNYKKFEVILIDNNSTDDSIEFVKNTFPSVIIIKLDKNYGFAYPNNVGAKNAKGDFLLFLNNDTIVDPQFMTELVKAMQKDDKIAICQSMLLKPNGEIDSSGDFIDSLGIAFSSKKKVENISEIFSAKGAAMMIRKNIFEKLSGFDEKFFVSFEDVDIGWRTWILGHKVVVVPKSIVHHIGGQTIYKMKSEIAFHGLKNQLSMKITNFESKIMIKNLFLFFLIYGFKVIRVLLDYKLKGKTKIRATNFEEKIAQKPQITTILKSLYWIFTNYTYLREKQELINSFRVLSTKELQKKNIIINNFKQ